MTAHKPVLAEEVLRYFDPKPNENYIDCTIGGGGHTEMILEKTGPKGKVLGFDWDAGAVKQVKESLRKYSSRLILVNASYTEMKSYVSEKDFSPINGILLDLGLSSDQLQSSGRGFSFQMNEPLDMRFSPDETELTAEIIVNEWSEADIIKILREKGEERFSGRIAKAIILARKEKRIAKTLELVDIVVKSTPRIKSRIHPATRTFQALRMEVNGELNNISKVLKDSLEIATTGTKIAVISFHSLEDRLVKEFFKLESTECICPPKIPVCRCGHKASLKILTKKPITASDLEISENWRSRSAKLRVAQKI
jgi:16S rRNA (cytosine1402-N4)-methyltransferase